MSLTGTKTFSANKKFFDGLAVGLFSSYLFNPVDKALYLTVRDKRSFFDPIVWKQPWKGVTKALYGRTLGYGVYFAIYDIAKNKGFSNTQASVLTGSCVSLASNPVNVVKMYHWNHDISNISLIKLASKMHSEFGPQIFWYGLKYTMARDTTYSVVFYKLNERFNKEKWFTKDVGLSCFATVLSSPLNYLRTRLYCNFSKPSSLKDMGKELIQDVKDKSYTPTQAFKYIACDRFCIGWGTLRVGVGMALTKKLYESADDIRGATKRLLRF